MSDPPRPSDADPKPERATQEPGAGEFLSEAQEVVETFSRNLLELDAQQRKGDYDPDLLNAAFRAIHSLKGLAALFGAAPVTELSHALETLLDDLRLGRLPLSQTVLDVLFEAVDAFGRMLGAFGHEHDDGEGARARLRGLLEKISNIGRIAPAPAPEPAPFGLDDSVLGVLTEYEEHRLRENLRLGRKLYRVHASFDLLAIDVGIEALKQKMKSFGEVITYLPSPDAGADDRIDLDILLGSEVALAVLTEGLAEKSVSVHEVGARKSLDALTSSRPRSPGRASETEPHGELGVGEDASVGEPHGGSELSLRSLSQTVRVELSRLDHLMNLIGELGVVQANFQHALEGLRAQKGTSDVSRLLEVHLRTMDRKLSLLQQGILDVRMVPLGQVFDKLARVVRKLGREAGKDIRLGITGAETELDKLIVEELSDPLMHMIRNCIDHGIESRDERVAGGKPVVGQIDLRAFQRGNRVVLEVEDDGHGMDWQQIRRTAVRRGLVSERESRELGAQEVIDFIFVPGFTTRDSATTVSGRGVGMDVVKTNIARLSGMIDVDTKPGRGTRFVITLPVTLAIIQALVVMSAGQTFCIPLNSVLESIMVTRLDIDTVEGHEVISLRGKTLPLLQLSRVFELQAVPPPTRHRRRPGRPELERVYVVIVGLAQHRIGLVVDELLGQQDVVIKPLGRALRAVPGIAGATEVAGGRTVLLLDVAAIVEEALAPSRGDGPRSTEVRVHGP